MECFKVIGYYICERIHTPQWLSGIGRQLMSVSGCIGEQHPRQECFLGGWKKGESRQYQERQGLNDRQYKELSETANHLFTVRRLDVDGRFLQLQDAREFYKKFCQALPCRVVSISTTMEYYQILENELRGSTSYGLMNGENDSSPCLGSDILGWDISGFHSFLCNSLQKDLSDARFNDTGLLDNEFLKVACFAHQLRGKGEPVEWIPCRLGVYEHAGDE